MLHTIGYNREPSLPMTSTRVAVSRMMVVDDGGRNMVAPRTSVPAYRASGIACVKDPLRQNLG